MKKASTCAKKQENLGFMLQSYGLYWFLRKHKQLNRRGYINSSGLLKNKPWRRNRKTQQHKHETIGFHWNFLKLLDFTKIISKTIGGVTEKRCQLTNSKSFRKFQKVSGIPRSFRKLHLFCTFTLKLLHRCFCWIIKIIKSIGGVTFFSGLWNIASISFRKVSESFRKFQGNVWPHLVEPKA